MSKEEEPTSKMQQKKDYSMRIERQSMQVVLDLILEQKQTMQQQQQERKENEQPNANVDQPHISQRDQNNAD